MDLHFFDYPQGLQASDGVGELPLNQSLCEPQSW